MPEASGAIFLFNKNISRIWVNKNTTKNVAVAMSGGVDSSVAAALLKEQGYNVIGLTMHIWDYDSVGGNVFHETSCCSVETMNDARSVCHALGIPHYVIDVRDEFEKDVISNFGSEYFNGRTPNPCVLCNSKIKWQVLLEKAVELECEYFSTGHYARVQYNEETGRYLLKRGTDLSKDQAYALWGLTQPQLKRTLFPLGELTKAEVRKYAGKLNLKTKDKQESQEICFIPDNDYSRFLTDKYPEQVEKIGRGKIVDGNGEVKGYHRGYPFYTIGQRKGLGIALGRPVYVTRINAESNMIVIGDKDDLKNKGLTAGLVNWIAFEKLAAPLEVEAKIRYNDPGKKAIIFPQEDGRVQVKFETFHSAITAGQSVVFFQDEVVVGGGIIEGSFME